MKSFTTLALAAASLASFVNAGPSGISPSNPPHQSESGQYGFNDCQKYKDSASSKCQTSWINSLNDFCLFAPPSKDTIGNSERFEVSWCSKANHGARLFPKGTITGATMIKTPNFVQITGKGDFTKLNVKKGDYGGELDPHGYDSKGNPIGGLVFGAGPKGNAIQFVEWAQFISDSVFCIRACYPGTDAKKWCPHIYDEMGCGWNMPGDYKKGTFDTCKADSGLMAGLYVNKGTTSTFHQGQAKTPAAHAAGKSSQCSAQKTVPAASYPKATSTKKSGKRQTEEDEL